MTTNSLTHPLPFFHHAATARVLYIAVGPCPLVFSISLKDIRKHAPVVTHGPVIHKATHPFGQSTAVASLAADDVRRDLGEATPLASFAMDTTSTWTTTRRPPRRARAASVSSGVRCDPPLASPSPCPAAAHPFNKIPRATPTHTRRHDDRTGNS